ncbi:phage Gp19/Gp15/Gp42 family protein [Collinsella sp. zg1085]|uniref:Gp19/Gp15/Gp42 family protein n=1 Tax=Collinsella sp. zg1085 TaxID=2844380 RepID=UPI001C0E5C47|nr:Gp19/Gp15/Gp42 family protein [Collinsella sp. zg1085]QWT18101.1 phage Gp19/Gp15/Gp42 family protein [Collinsella sp. zg1085]
MLASFASIDEYSLRFGAPTDVARAEALLGDASAVLINAYEDFYGDEYTAGAHPSFDRSATSVACMLANRVLSAPISIAGATQFTQAAGGYSASVSYGAGLGELYLGKSDLKRLGLVGQRLNVLTPYERDEA